MGKKVVCVSNPDRGYAVFRYWQDFLFMDGPQWCCNSKGGWYGPLTPITRWWGKDWMVCGCRFGCNAHQSRTRMVFGRLIPLLSGPLNPTSQSPFPSHHITSNFPFTQSGESSANLGVRKPVYKSIFSKQSIIYCIKCKLKNPLLVILNPWLLKLTSQDLT